MTRDRSAPRETRLREPIPLTQIIPHKRPRQVPQVPSLDMRLSVHRTDYVQNN